MALAPALQAHLDTGLTTLCRAWSITRQDGVEFGFTDHDRDLDVDGTTYRADTGLTAMSLQQTTGLAVDNTEALGALSDASLREEDILAGRFDGAEILGWLINWASPDQRELVFRGSIGQVSRIDGAFRAEVRGLSEALNQPRGRVIQRTSTRLVDDTGQPFDLTQTGYVFSGTIATVQDRAVFFVDDQGAFSDGWFRFGALTILSGTSQGLGGVVKRDERQEDGTRRVELWEPLRTPLAIGDSVQMTAGFDGRFETAQSKFNNAINFQGFPDVPEDDWVITAAPSAVNKTGGSRR